MTTCLTYNYKKKWNLNQWTSEISRCATQLDAATIESTMLAVKLQNVILPIKLLINIYCPFRRLTPVNLENLRPPLSHPQWNPHWTPSSTQAGETTWATLATTKKTLSTWTENDFAKIPSPYKSYSSDKLGGLTFVSKKSSAYDDQSINDVEKEFKLYKVNA